MGIDAPMLSLHCPACGHQLCDMRVQQVWDVVCDRCQRSWEAEATADGYVSMTLNAGSRVDLMAVSLCRTRDAPE